MSGVVLQDATVLITGAAGGIGTATARRFARVGARVLCTDIDRAGAERVAEECAALGARAESHVCDVADASAVTALAEAVGPVDVLVNNAGVGVLGPFLECSVEDWQWLRSINLDGVAHGCFAFGPGMLARGRGQVVNVASMAAYTPNRDLAAYCASKAAVVSLSQCLRAGWRGTGVGVSVVCPGLTDTPIAASSRYRGGARDKQAKAVRTLGWGRSPDLVAKAIVDCAERDRDVVPVGIDSKIAYKLLRGAPQPVQQLVARAGLL